MRWCLKLYREEHFLMEVGIEFHVAGELQLKVHRPKSVSKNGDWRSFWVEEQRARDGWCTWRRL